MTPFFSFIFTFFKWNWTHGHVLGSLCCKFFLAKLKQTWREKGGGSGDSVSKLEERRKQREKVGGKAATTWATRRKGGDSVIKCVERWSQREEVGGTAERDWDSRRKSRQRSCGVTEARWEAVTMRGHTCDNDYNGGDRIQWKRVDGNDNQPTGSRSATPF